MKITDKIKSFTKLANQVIDNIILNLAEKNRKDEANELLQYAKLSPNSAFAKELIADGAEVKALPSLQSMRSKVFPQQLNNNPTSSKKYQ